MLPKKFETNIYFRRQENKSNLMEKKICQFVKKPAKYAKTDIFENSST